MWRFQQKFASELKDVVVRSSFETPGATPRAETPRAESVSAAAGEATQIVDTDLPLDKFLNKYTSEDNAAFDVIFERNMRDRKKQYAWQRAGIEGDERIQELEAIQAPSGAAPLTWPYKVKNSLMYQPEGIGSVLKPGDPMGPPKQVIHSNTRLDVKPLAKLNPGSTRLTGRHEFSLMRSPSPAPGADASPLVTWGQIDGTPVQLDGGGLGDIIPNPFGLAPTAPREQVGLNLSNKASARMAKRKGQHHKRNVVNPRSGSLSPAAQRLLAGAASPAVQIDSQLRSAYRRASSRTPMVSPSPRHPGSRSQRAPSSSRARTPSEHVQANIRPAPSKHTTPILASASMTDGLLKL